MQERRPRNGGGVDSITLDRSELLLEVKGTTTLQAKINGVVSTAVTWESDRPSIAKVDTNGKVTAVKAGTATITATAKADTTKKAVCTVTVTEKNNANEITLDQKELSLGVGDSATLKASIDGAVSAAVTWSSDEPDIAKVDSNGKVMAVSAGTATITATANADKTQKATCTVKVEGADVVQPSGIAVSPTSLSLKEGDTDTLTATIDNADKLDADHKKITWTSSNESVATVNDNGRVTAVSAGTAKITAKTTNEKEATCTVTVTARPTWNFVGKVDEVPYKDFDSSKAGSISSDISIPGENNNLTLVLSSKGTGVGNTTSTPNYKYQNNNGLCIKGAALKIDGIKGVVKVTIEWYLGGSSDRNLEVTVNGKTVSTASGTTVGDKTAYTDTFDAGDGTTLYIGASNELYIKSITIEPQSGGGTTPPTTTNPPYAGAAPKPIEDIDHSSKAISLNDPVLGYASLGTGYVTTGTKKEVSTRAELLAAIKQGGVIVVTAMIDMSDGYLPDSTSDFPNLKTLDSFVESQNKGYNTYAEWVNAYALACTKDTEDKSEDTSNSSLYDTVWAFNKAYGDIIKLSVESNTTLIGAGPNCGIRGGSIQITSKENVQIRNLIIKDAFDPFPHHEAGDQYNAQWDGVVVEGSKNVWIDHCTFEDTLAVGHVYTAGKDDEKWQMYDGLCDIKNRSKPAAETTNVTVSNCIFRNHDKTMLIGSSDSDGDNTKRFVTLQGNYFYNCGQRLPMVRNTTIHILNNYYDADSKATYSQSYAVGCRANSIIYAEANYFGSGIKYSFKNNDGKLYASGNKDNATCETTVSGSTLFSTAVKAYAYTPVTAEQAKTTAMSSAGAGYTLKQ